MTLDDAIATLYVREINCGCETFWDGGIRGLDRRSDERSQGRDHLQPPPRGSRSGPFSM
jgi:hypothetical protein